jgi:hypothetical protein
MIILELPLKILNYFQLDSTKIYSLKIRPKNSARLDSKFQR